MYLIFKVIFIQIDRSIPDENQITRYPGEAYLKLPAADARGLAPPPLCSPEQPCAPPLDYSQMRLYQRSCLYNSQSVRPFFANAQYVGL